MSDIKLTTKELLKKDFKSKIRGYDPTEVDGFLDTVISDYRTFGEKLREKNQTISKLRQNVTKLQQYIRKMNRNVPRITPRNSLTVLRNLSRRVNTLERYVYGQRRRTNYYYGRRTR